MKFNARLKKPDSTWISLFESVASYSISTEYDTLFGVVWNTDDPSMGSAFFNSNFESSSKNLGVFFNGKFKDV